MSLINEALKKAQRQRSLEAAPLSSAPSGVAAAAVATHERVATRRRSSLAPIWFGLALLVLGAGATALVMHYGILPKQAADPTRVASASPTIAAPAPSTLPSTEVAALVPVPAPNAPAPTAQAPALSPPAETAVHMPPIASVRTDAQMSPVATPPPATPVTAKPLAAVPANSQESANARPATGAIANPTEAPVEVTPVPAPEQQIAAVADFLKTARLSGVRGQGAQARVLMNERVYRINELVANELGLRLSAVRSGLLVFTDAQGRTYEKSY